MVPDRNDQEGKPRSAAVLNDDAYSASDGSQRRLAIAGIIAPFLLIGLVTVLGLFEPGFDHLTEMMSILGGVGGWRGFVFNMGGAIVGLLLIAFAVGLHRGIGGGRGLRLGPIMVAISGVGMVGSAIFHCDLGCANVITRTSTGLVHIVVALFTGPFLAISLFAVFPRLVKDKRWEKFGRFTLAMGILGNTPGLILWLSFFTTRIPAWEGMIQRLGIFFPLLWVEVMSINLLRLSTRDHLQS